MSDLAAAGRILTVIAQALDEADDWAPSTIVTVYDLAGHLQLDPGPDDHTIAAALLDAARSELAVPEVQCPACAATIRARLMDQPGALAAKPEHQAPLPPAAPPTLDDVDPTLIERLRDLGDRWGPLGVALAAALLTDPGVVVSPPTRTLAEADLPLAYELCAQVCESESATVAGHFLGQLRDLLGPAPAQREPRVWLVGDTVPAGVTVTDGSWTSTVAHAYRPTVAVVEVLVPDFAAAVAAEQARRAATDSEVTE